MGISEETESDVREREILASLFLFCLIFSHDLTLAFNKVSYVASGTKNSKGVWTLKIKFKDTYDFDCDKWTNVKGFRAATINGLNSYGKYAQSIGAVVPYKIQIEVRTTFSE